MRGRTTLTPSKSCRCKRSISSWANKNSLSTTFCRYWRSCKIWRPIQSSPRSRTETPIFETSCKTSTRRWNTRARNNLKLSDSKSREWRPSSRTSTTIVAVGAMYRKWSTNQCSINDNISIYWSYKLISEEI